MALSVVIPAIAVLCLFSALLGFGFHCLVILWCIGRGILMRLCHSLHSSIGVFRPSPTC